MAENECSGADCQDSRSSTIAGFQPPRKRGRNTSCERISRNENDIALAWIGERRKIANLQTLRRHHGFRNTAVQYFISIAGERVALAKCLERAGKIEYFGPGRVDEDCASAL